jgi:bacteriocin-like protein
MGEEKIKSEEEVNKGKEPLSEEDLNNVSGGAESTQKHSFGEEGQKTT